MQRHFSQHGGGAYAAAIYASAKSWHVMHYAKGYKAASEALEHAVTEPCGMPCFLEMKETMRLLQRSWLCTCRNREKKT